MNRRTFFGFLAAITGAFGFCKFAKAEQPKPVVIAGGVEYDIIGYTTQSYPGIGGKISIEEARIALGLQK